MESLTFLIANALGFALKRFTPARKIIPWVVVGANFLLNIAKSYGAGEPVGDPASNGAVGMIGFISWDAMQGVLFNTVKESAYSLGMHTFGKNAIMQGVLASVFQKTPAPRKR